MRIDYSVNSAPIRGSVLLFLRTACRRNDSIHPEIFDDLAIMVHGMGARERANTASRCF